MRKKTARLHLSSHKKRHSWQIRPLLITLLFVLVALAVYFLLNNFAHKSTLQKATLYDKLSHLNTQVQIDSINELLGKPTLVNYGKDRQTTENIYVNNNYLVQAITNSDAKVLAYAVTTRKADFTPLYSYPPFDITLGKSTFGDIEKTTYKPDRCFLFRGNTAPQIYFESYYLGRPGGYQTFIFGYNNSGAPCGKTAGNFRLSNLDNEDTGVTNVDCQTINQEKRNSLTINTYMLVAPLVDFDSLQINFEDRFIGADINQVNLLK